LSTKRLRTTKLKCSSLRICHEHSYKLNHIESQYIHKHGRSRISIETEVMRIQGINDQLKYVLLLIMIKRFYIQALQ